MQPQQSESEIKQTEAGALNDLTPQQISQALAHIGHIASHDNSCQKILDTLKEEIEALLHPAYMEVALRRPGQEMYHVSGSQIPLPPDDPLVAWLIKQPAGIPIDLASETMPEKASASAKKIQGRGISLILPLGKQGWVGLKAPEAQETYTTAQRTTLQSLAQPTAVGLRRAIIVEEQERRVQELEAFYLITQAVNFTMPIDDIMELIYTQLERVIPIPNFYMALHHPETETLSYAFYIQDEERVYIDDEWSVHDTLTGIILKTGVTIRTNDYLLECRNRNVKPGHLEPRAWMGVPLMAGDRVIGVLVAYVLEPGITFSAEHESFFVSVAAQTASIIERTRLYEGLEARARQLATLNEIGKLLASSLDQNEVLELVVRHAAKLLDAEAGSLLLLDEDSGDLVFEISSGTSGSEKLVGLKVPAGKGIAGATFSENRPIIVNDTEQDRRWYNNFDERSEFTTRSVIAVPLNARGRTIGVLEVLNRKEQRFFTSEETELLLAFGAQAAIAIENARLFTMTDQALQARLEEITTIQHIIRQLNASLDYREVMGKTLSWSIRVTGATIGLIAALREEEDGTRGLQFLANRGYPEEVFQQYSEQELWPLDKGIIGKTIRQGGTSLLTDVAESSDYVSLVEGMQSQLTVPILRENRVIGVIALESKEADTFKEENMDFVVRLADHAAIAIQNAMLFQQVQRANEAKTEFVSFVSHELKQPMTSMKGYIDLLTKGIGGPVNDNQMQFLKIIRSNVERMNRLVQDLLDISRIESGRLRLEIDKVQPEEVVSESVRAFEQEIKAKQQNLQVHIDAAAPLPAVEGDRGRLIQVLTNLVSNASKYTPENGDITIEVKPTTMDDEAFVLWSVQDTGIGMTQEELERLFTKYFRSDNPMVRSVQGTGLGLVITQSIVELHGGQIWVESEPNEGSTFSFTIPVVTS